MGINSQSKQVQLDASLQKVRRDGFNAVLLGCLAFILVGFLFSAGSSSSGADFEPPYYAARAAVSHLDPYIEQNTARLFNLDHPLHPAKGSAGRNATLFVYPPTLFVATVPIAALPYGVAHWLWVSAIACFFILSALLIWSVASQWSPQAATFLVFLCVVNAPYLLLYGNPAGLAVSLCIIGSYCIIERRAELAGVAALALSLMIKPHDGAFVWLYFLLAGGEFRKRALQSLAFALLLSAPFLVWTTEVAPSWAQEMRSNLVALGIHGGTNDPGPASRSARGTGMIVSLQRTMSEVRDDSGFYNPVAYLVGGALLLVWAILVLRSQCSSRNAWFALAAVSAISMVGFYHRLYDAKLLMLAVPACTMLRMEAGNRWQAAVWVPVATLLATGDVFWLFIFNVFGNPYAWSYSSKMGKVLIIASSLPAPLALLTFGVFFLAVFRSRSTQDKFAARVPDAEYS